MRNRLSIGIIIVGAVFLAMQVWPVVQWYWNLCHGVWDLVAPFWYVSLALWIWLAVYPFWLVLRLLQRWRVWWMLLLAGAAFGVCLSYPIYGTLWGLPVFTMLHVAGFVGIVVHCLVFWGRSRNAGFSGTGRNLVEVLRGA